MHTKHRLLEALVGKNTCVSATVVFPEIEVTLPGLWNLWCICCWSYLPHPEDENKSIIQKSYILLTKYPTAIQADTNTFASI